MKLFIAFLGGFGLTLLSFGGGIALAIVYFTAEPVQRPGPSADTAAAWPSEPVRVENDDGLQRLPDRPVSAAAPPKVELAADAESEGLSDGAIDTTTTASVERADRGEPEEATRRFDRDVVMLRQQHLDWCWRRYNSYRPEDNSYQPYGGGGRKPCLSPFLDEAEFTAESGEDPAEASGEGGYIQAELIEPSAGEGPTVRMTREHIQHCFERYRSYRPEDNTYQPYGGGPRRQCR